jgi:hypothetical protein
MENEVLINRVAESALTTINLEDFYPSEEVVLFDLKDFLFMNLILKEKDYREALKNHDWKQYENKIVAFTCSADAIIPMWAYMLAGSYLQPVAKQVVFGTADDARQELLFRNIRAIDIDSFEDKRVVVKGCGEKPVGEKAYLEICLLLRPVVKSIMYGEPCSTVPVFKKPLAK